MSRSNTLEYIYKAVDNMSGTIKRIRKQQKGLAKEANLSSRAMTAFSKGASKSVGFLKNRLIGFGALAGAGFGMAEFFSIGSKFQDTMVDLSAITGATGKDFDFLKGKSLELSKTTKTFQSEVAEGIKLVASAKPELLDNLPALIETTKQVLLLKNAAGIDLADAANIGAQSLNIFGENATQANRFVNVLAAGAKFGASEIRQTGEAVLLSGGAAKNAGLQFEQLNALIQTAARGGFKGSQAGTALNAMLSRLQRKGIDFKKLGIEKSFQLVKDKLDSLTTSTQRALFASEIFGEEHSKVGFALIDNIKYMAQYERTLSGTNVAQEQSDKRLKTLSARMRGLGVAISEKIIVSFDKMEPKISKSIDSVIKFVESITTKDVEEMTGKVITIAEGFSIVGEAISPVIALTKGLVISLKDTYTLLKAIGNWEFKGIRFDIQKDIDALTFGGKFLGMFDLNPVPPPSTVGGSAANGFAKSESKTDINVNINAPQGVVGSVGTKTTGGNVNVGLNPS